MRPLALETSCVYDIYHRKVRLSLMLARTHNVQSLLTVPSVRAIVNGPEQLCALEIQKDQQTVLEHPKGELIDEQRDWRELRRKLIQLNMADKKAVSGWLAAAGYRIETIEPEISRWLKRCRAALAWCMTVDRDEFRKATATAFSYFGRIVFPQEQAKFREAIGAPMDVDARVLQTFLSGFKNAPTLRAWFCWGPDGQASVKVDVSTPMEALGLSMHIDRGFTAVQWRQCRNCGELFEPKKKKEFCCCRSCANNFTTKRTREKVRLVHEADERWQKLSQAKRKKLDRWTWIAERANENCSYPGKSIDPAWARKVTHHKRG